MNALQKIRRSPVVSTIRQLHRPLSGNVHRINDLLLTPGRGSIKKLNEMDKGNATQLYKIKLLYRHSSGYYSLMPFLHRSYAKLVRAIEHQMDSIGGQRLLMPSIYPIGLLQKSDRLDALKNELFTLSGRNERELYLAPTHEEPVTSIAAQLHLNRPQFPLLLYQIDSKFRNEIRPRFGLLRANQFIMKDLYSFDLNRELAIETYEKVCQAYQDLFNHLGLNFIKVKASNGLIGGEFSHEFHLVSKHGEDDIFVCHQCKTAYNKEVMAQSAAQANGEEAKVEEASDGERKVEEAKVKEMKGERVKVEEPKQCPECNSEMEHQQSIEIGHTFYLGTKYSEKLNALSPDKQPLEMCCFGIGVTRILSAFIAQSESIEIDWPLRIAPYHLLIIPPKRGSKENVDEIGTRMADCIADSIASKGYDVLIDNRSGLTIGRRRIDSLAYGFPFRVIVGRESIDEVPRFELHHSNQKPVCLTHAELMAKFEEIKSRSL